jgi:hypothetical protein
LENVQGLLEKRGTALDRARSAFDSHVGTLHVWTRGYLKRAGATAGKQDKPADELPKRLEEHA